MIDAASLWVLVAMTLGVYAVKYIISKCQRDPRKVKFAETLPGPPEWPIIGNSMNYFKEGMNFAMFEMKLAMIALLRNFTFYTKMKMEDLLTGGEFAITVNGFKLNISSRIRKPKY